MAYSSKTVGYPHDSPNVNSHPSSWLFEYESTVPISLLVRNFVFFYLVDSLQIPLPRYLSSKVPVATSRDLNSWIQSTLLWINIIAGRQITEDIYSVTHSHLTRLAKNWQLPSSLTHVDTISAIAQTRGRLRQPALNHQLNWPRGGNLLFFPPHSTNTIFLQRDLSPATR